MREKKIEKNKREEFRKTKRRGREDVKGRLGVEERKRREKKDFKRKEMEGSEERGKEQAGRRKGSDEKRKER